MKKVFSKKGFNVFIANSGEEAIAKALKKNFDIAFIDIKLTAINGLETYPELKKINKDINAIIMTAYREEVKDLVDEAIKNSAYACLYKPLDLEKVLSIVGRIKNKQPIG